MLLAFDFGFGQMNDLIISEYAEGSSNNKYLELFNGTGSDIDLSNYEIWRIENGGTVWPEQTITLTGILSTGSTYVLANPSADPIILALADQIDFQIRWNGDDATALVKDDGTGAFNLIDVIGTSGSDPGIGWNVGGTTDATLNHTLVRKPGICSTNTNWSTSAGTTVANSEWIILPQNEWSNLGTHTTTCCVNQSTWVSGAWIPNAPNLTTQAIIDENYDTNASGSFQACSLIVSSGNTLTIGDATFVEVEHDLTVEATASIYVASQGAFVQNEDSSIITNDGTIEVTKMTAPSNNWYEYTYWSSPVLGETIANGLFESNVYRRYLFKAENFLDATAETNNNNATVTGQDDFDDNGDDWERVYGTTVMQPGIGYASMHDPSGFSGPGAPPYQFSYTFEGDFNNGVITVPIHRNDSETNDNNWNFVGNPYPSAIDADLFLATNSNISTSVAGPGYLNGAIFLWSQNTLPSSVANGNEPLNFSNDDFSIINASGETTGGDGTSAVVLTPSGHRAIPSGQGFFVVFSDGVTPISTSGDIATATVTFNNAMRVTDVTANSLFFKGVSSKNTAIADKLWINLTSDVGIYNQILISYINGATNEDDGLTYDATKYPVNSGAALYSTIDGSNKKFAIQGKAVESINEEEVIHIGFNNYINNNIPYVLSIDKLQGDFLNNNTVYLKDNLLNIYHNLSEGDYNFTSETGEFQNRFEVVFKADSTLTTDAIINNESTLQIIQRDSNRVTFKTGTSATISSIVIYDLFGRKLYQFKGANSSETFSLSNINTAIYLAQVELSTGEVITKKAIKR